MFVLLFISFWTLVFFYNFYWKRKNLPPGPTPLPLIGNLLSFGLQKSPYEKLIEWHKKYGPVHTYWFGEKPVVAVTDYSLMKETFIKDGDSYTGRDFFTEFFVMLKGGLYGFITEGDWWKNQRRFTLHNFREFGMGRNIIEPIIMKEVKRLLAYADNHLKSGSQEVDLVPAVEICVGSIINNMLLGYRFEGDNEAEFYRLKSLMVENVELISHPLALIMNMSNPKFWKNFPFFKSLLKRMLNNGEDLMDFFEDQMENAQRNYAKNSENSEKVSFVQAFLKERQRRQESGEDIGEFLLIQLKSMLFDLWSAGQETTTNTLTFGIAYIMKHSEVQKKMQEEIDRVVGNERHISLSDRPKLHYVNAVINEVQRTCNLLPINLFHRTTKDVIVDGYKIANGTTIVPQLSVVMYDDKIFPEPEKFIPERFLDDHGHFKKIEEVVPFSIGKRQCLGESLSRDELFLFLANLVHELKVMPIDPNEGTKVDVVNGFTMRPKPYKVKLERRIASTF